MGRSRVTFGSQRQSQIIQGGTFRQLEISESGVCIKPDLIGDVERITLGNILCQHPYETAGEIRRKLGRRALIYHHVIDQGRRKHIERKGTAVRLAGRGRGVVQPYIIITLRQTPDHDETVVHDVDSRDTA